MEDEEYITSKELSHVIPMVKIALIMIGLSTEDNDYYYVKDFLENRIYQDYPSPEDAYQSDPLKFKRIIEETIEHLECLESMQKSLDTLEVLINGVADRDDTDTPNL